MFILATAKDGKNIYTCLSTDSKLTADVTVGDECVETDSGNVFRFTGTYWTFVDAAARVNKNRRIDLAALTAKGCTWLPSALATSVTLLLVPTVVSTNIRKCLIVFDAPSVPVRDAWIAQAESAVLDYPPITIQVGIESKPFNFASYLTSLDAYSDVAGVLYVRAK